MKIPERKEFVSGSTLITALTAANVPAVNQNFKVKEEYNEIG